MASPTRSSRPGEINAVFLDRYSILHAASGAFLAARDVPAVGTFLLATTFELVELPLKKHIPIVFPVPTYDTKANAMRDVLAAMVGWGLVTTAKGRKRRHVSQGRFAGRRRR